MFQATHRRQGRISSALTLMILIYHSIVRSVRKSHSNALWAIGTNVLQAVIFVAAFYVIFSFLGLRAAAPRGDFLLYIMSGVFIFLSHTKAMSAVIGAEGPSSPMMQHAPMNTIIVIAAAALGALYIQVLSLALILFIYHIAFTPIDIQEPAASFGMLLLAWFVGAAIGLILLAIKPWAPQFVSIFNTVYQRANMVASGKLFVANTLPGFMLSMFDWNPLFHCIDQARGFIFINYVPRYTDWTYAVWTGLILVMLGLMGEFYTRRHVSLSWNARR